MHITFYAARISSPDLLLCFMWFAIVQRQSEPMYQIYTVKDSNLRANVTTVVLLPQDTRTRVFLLFLYVKHTSR